MPQVARQFSDINLSMIAHPVTGDIVPLRGVESIRRSVRNIILTSNYERPYQPDFGAGVYDMLFELLTPATKHLMQSKIRSQIQRYEPRAEVQDVAVSPMPDQNSLVVTVIFRPMNAIEPIQVDVILERVR